MNDDFQMDTVVVKEASFVPETGLVIKGQGQATQSADQPQGGEIRQPRAL